MGFSTSQYPTAEELRAKRQQKTVEEISQKADALERQNKQLQEKLDRIDKALSGIVNEETVKQMLTE